MMNGSKQVLFVFLATNKVAEIHFIDDKFQWHYEKNWLKIGFALSPHLPLNRPVDSINIQRFLKNLLPEGQGLDELLQRFNLSQSNTFGISLALGDDLPGAIVLLGSEKKKEAQTFFRQLSYVELNQRLGVRDDIGLIFWDDKPRLSVAGVQDKINLVMNEQDELGFGEGDLCSTHILKFEKKAHIHLVINEFISMQLAKSCGLNVANCKLLRFSEHSALLVERFDRKFINEKLVKRRHVIDGCQALNLPPEYKYEQNFGNGRDVAHIREGASLKKLFALVQLCETPAKAKLQLIDWLMFNLLIFNFDAHGKNISFFVGRSGLKITPFYDLVNIALYPHFDQNLAMALGDEFDGQTVNAYQLADFSEQCHLPRKLVAQRLSLMASRIEKSIHKLDYTFIKNEAENDYINKYKMLVSHRANHLLTEAPNIIDTTL